MSVTALDPSPVPGGVPHDASPPSWMQRHRATPAGRFLGVDVAARSHTPLLMSGVLVACWAQLFTLGALDIPLVTHLATESPVAALVALVAVFAIAPLTVRLFGWLGGFVLAGSVALWPNPSLSGVYDLVVAASVGAAVVLSLLAHEAAHVHAGRRCGLRADGVVITGFGAAAVFPDDRFASASAMVRTTVVGPVTNAVLALGALALAELTGSPVFTAFAVINGAVALLNALPLPPMDGGWVLAGIVWAVRPSLGHDRSVQVAWALGAAFITALACVLAVVAATGHGPVGILAGFCVVAILSAVATRRSIRAMEHAAGQLDQ
jgi:Zn-dependent protease